MQFTVLCSGRVIGRAAAALFLGALLASAASAASGDLDEGFSGDGTLTTPVGVMGGGNRANAVAVRSGGKIIAVGSASNGANDDFAVASFNENGSPDTTFDTDGQLVIAPGTETGEENATAVAILGDGRIVVAGYAWNGSNRDFALVRLQENGSLDGSFSGDGRLVYSPVAATGDEEITALAIQGDGKIVAAGHVPHCGGCTADFAVVRLKAADGSVDPDFNGGNTVTTDIGTNDYARALLIQPDGKLVVAGCSFTDGSYDFALVRYNTNGSLDDSGPGFGIGGKVTTPIGGGEDCAYSIARQSDGKLIAAGYAKIGASYDFALFRYNPDGTPDTEFGDEGKVTAAVGAPATIRSVIVRPNGKLVVSGSAFNGTNLDFIVARYNSDGSPDMTFGVDGKVTTPIGPGDNAIQAAVLQSGARLAAAGYASDGTNVNFALARYFIGDCGDGTTEADEACDRGIANGTPPSCCSASCTIVAGGTTCRAAAGVCDAAETCTGTADSCPGDTFLASATVCRATAGICDVSESCTGSSATCPVNAFVLPATPCRASAGVCDVAESCTGSSATCPANAFVSSASTCRPSAGICDAVEKCTGSGASCPLDTKSTAVCRGAMGVCDAVETCSGSSNACPADAKTAAVCRGAATVCDAAESCNGTGNDCPANAFVGTGTTCRVSAGVCDVAENCSGTSSVCPEDLKRTTPCRASAGDCDVAETCDGAATSCPLNQFVSSGEACGNSTDETCDGADTCDGAGTCQANVAADDTPCEDKNICTFDRCSQGLCVSTDVSGCPYIPEGQAEGDRFGSATAIAGEFLVVGAPAPEKDGSGRVFVLRPTNNVYAADGPPLQDPDSATGALNFGASVDADANTIVVGAPGDIRTVPGGASLGSASVFVREGDAWTLQQKLLDTSRDCPQFGTDVAISGDTIVVGAPEGDCAVVFERHDGVWTLVTTLQEPSGSKRFGQSVDVFGSAIVVGAPGIPSGFVCAAGGVVYFYRRTESEWVSSSAIEEPSEGGGGSCYGAAVGIGETTAVIGAPGDDTDGSDAGAVYVVEANGEDWEIAPTPLLAFSETGPASGFGASLDIVADAVIVGAPGAAAFLFERAPDALGFSRAVAGFRSSRQYLPPDDKAAEGVFGSSVSTGTFGGATGGAVGAPGEDSEDLVDAGAVYGTFGAQDVTDSCGDNVTTLGEDCDDGDTTWATGEYCNASCRALGCGDTNDDEKLSASDAQFALRAAVSLEDCDTAICDANGDGKVQAGDAQLLLLAAVGTAVDLLCPGGS